MRNRSLRVRFALLCGFLAGALAVPLVAPAQAEEPAPAETSAATPKEYTNPITADFADTYADPVIIRGKDGLWYLYATSDPLVSGGEFGVMHVASSADMVDWNYLGTVFDEDSAPSWATDSSYFWAPDVRYVDGQYVMYFTVTDTTINPGGDSAIGVATAPTPAGPWTSADEPVVAPRPAPGGDFFWTFDPAMLLDDDGSRYLYFGSYHGGLWVTELDESGLKATGELTRVAAADRYEGAFVVKRDGYYYLMGSSANCCAGPVTGYSVYAARSTDPRGPFLDHEGQSTLDFSPGGTQMLVQNGNRWVGVGHHTVVQDLSGQDWILYHGIDRDEPWLAAPGGVNRRPTLMDRLDWIDGWPLTRAGAGPSELPQTAPVTGSLLGIDSADPAAGDAIRGDISSASEPFSGPHAVLEGTARSSGKAPKEVHVDLDLRSQGAPLELTLAGAGRNGIVVTVDPGKRKLTANYSLGSHSGTTSATIPAGHDLGHWTALSVHAADGQLTVRLSESRLGDVVAEVMLPLRNGSLKSRPLALSGQGVDVDNLAVNQAHEPVTEKVPEPVPGELVMNEEFDGDLSSWQWVREDTAATVADGALNWPLRSVDITGSGGSGGLLLQQPPAGDWIMETKLHLDLGEDGIRNYQQAGLLVYVDDDNFLRLGDVAIWGSRQVEFGKEIRDGGQTRFAAHLGGPTAATMWLRIHHTTSAEGELLYRAATSRDGDHWRWGATWTLPAGSDPQVGLYTGGGADPATVAQFDYVRIHTA